MGTFAHHPFTLRQLQYAVAVADERHFRRAAERCHVSQPSLSAQLAQLEDSLGVKLFERDARRVIVTAAGAEIVKRARRALLESDDILETARQLADPFVGLIQVGVIPTIAPYLLPDIVPALRRAYPRASLAWREAKTEDLVRDVEEGALDAALLALEADLGGLSHEVIAKDPFVLAAPRSHPLGRHKGPVGLQELAGAEVLLLDEGHCLREQALSLCARAGAPETSLRATSLGTLTQMVLGGAGVTLLPTLAVPLENRRGELVIRKLRTGTHKRRKNSGPASAPARTIALAYRSASPLARAMSELAATMRTAYPSP